jgi:hypothetical protein
MNRTMIVPLAGALALATTLDLGVTAASAAPLGIAPQGIVAAPSQVTDVQYRYRRYRRGYGWGGPAVGAAVGLGILGAAGAAAAAASNPYYGGYGYGYPAYGGYGGYGCYPGYNC